MRQIINARKCLDRDVIKYMATFFMLLNHIAYVFLDAGTLSGEIMTDIGYFTAPVMISFMTEGYEYTRDRRKYAARLLLFALLSQLPFSLAFTRGRMVSFVSFNMLFTLLACYAIVHIMKNMSGQWKENVFVAGLALFTCFSDWGGIAPVFTVLLVRAGEDRLQKKKAWLYLALIFGGINFLNVLDTRGIGSGLVHGALCTGVILLASFCMLELYSGKHRKNGRKFSKWFFYFFYPVHLLVLGILRLKLL